MSEEQATLEIPVELAEAAHAVSTALQADVILFNRGIDEESASLLHVHLDNIVNRRETGYLVLVTNGGDPHAAYSIGRELQLRYKKVVLCIAGDCYSAGTLLACCAHEIVIGLRGRLGPLDVQILKKDELYESLSGLTASSALDELSTKAVDTLTWMALRLKGAFGWPLSFRTAMDVAATMTSQMFGEVYKQIDPIRLAEDARALKIAVHYGGILNRTSKNLQPHAIERLTKGYPSHQCIIDASEASELFVTSRPPGPEERKLLQLLGQTATDAAPADASLIYVFPQMAHQGDTNGQRARSSAPKSQSRLTHHTNGKSGDPAVLAGGSGSAGAGNRAAESG